MASGYVGLAFLAATLVLGPLKVLRNRPRPLSDDLRRDLGIWTAIVSVVHVVVGLQMHMSGAAWLYFFYGAGDPRPRFWPLPLRIDVFGLANHTGLLATLLLVLLLLLSNDLSMRALGNRKWKRLQQLNYALLALVIVHGILYQRNETQELGWMLLFWSLWLAAAVLQLVGFRVRSSRIAARGSNLAPADLAESTE
jgi:sulfoxide reductase heme-binding subunit YedZ